MMSVHVTCRQKLMNVDNKNMHANFETLLISKILMKYFAEMFYYCFIKASFVVNL